MATKNIYFLKFTQALLTLTALSFLPSSKVHAEIPDYRPIIITEHLVTGVHIHENTISDDRFGVVTIGTSIRHNGTLKFRQQQIASIDCKNQGFEIVQEAVNTEDDSEAPPKWVYLSTDHAYKEGFNPREIQHKPVAEVLASRRKMAMAAKNLDEHQRNILAEPPFFPDSESAAVSYFCAVAKEKMEKKAAAEKIRATGGIEDIKMLNCLFGMNNGNNLEVTVRFSESKNMVQVQGEWVKERSVTGDRIAGTRKQALLTISRTTGQARLEIAENHRPGRCEITQYGQRKF